MSRLFKDREHLVRLAGLFAGGLLAFLVLKTLFIPTGFGVYGHYRSGALEENADKPLVHAGNHACAECHEDIVGVKSGGPHAHVSCEACHGPLAAHAEDPSNEPQQPNGRALCLNCHARNVARPATFPQIDIADHGDEDSECITCHLAHNPFQAPEVAP